MTHSEKQEWRKAAEKLAQWKIEIESDYDADFSWLGEFIYKPEPGAVDLQTGKIMGDLSVEKTFVIDLPEGLPNTLEAYITANMPADAPREREERRLRKEYFDKIERLCEEQHGVNPDDFDTWDCAHWDWTEDENGLWEESPLPDNQIAVHTEGPEILHRGNLPSLNYRTGFNSRDSYYLRPANYDLTDPEQQTAENYSCVMQEAAYLINIYNGEVPVVGVAVTLHIPGMPDEIRASLWGIDLGTDYGWPIETDGYLVNEVIPDLKAECMDQLPQHLESKRDAIIKNQAALAQLMHDLGLD